MLEIRKSSFARSYENFFFREFSRLLFNSFKSKNLSGVLIGSPLCEVDERLQIDALLITTNVVCIIDFKNFKGKIKLPAEKDFELGLWTTETGEQIHGGNSINPFIQLKNQKMKFVDVYNKYIKTNLAATDIFDPSHLVRVACFQEDIELIGRIPDKEALNFFILDRKNYLEKILDIVDVTDKSVKLTQGSFGQFKKVFRADPFQFEETTLENELKEFACKSTTLDYEKLYDDQKSALTKIRSFLENPKEQVFILLGTINSGKSFLLPFIREIAYRAGISETVIFATSNRVAKNLVAPCGMDKVNSIYSYIYGGRKTKTEEKEEVQEKKPDEGEEQNTSGEFSLEVLEMKICDNSENALFIVDESQLLSDSFYQSLDLMFGTGYLLKDFISFTNFTESRRKIIFIGDPFQLQYGNTKESPLSTEYLQDIYQLSVSSFELFDKDKFSDINEQALNCVQSLRDNIFNSLRFVQGNQISFLTKEDILPCVTKLVEKNIDAHLISFSNEEALKINRWIKDAIIKTGRDISAGDLVLFNNNISVEDESDPFAEPKRIYNGQFATVLNVSQDIIDETIAIKGVPVTISFRECVLQLKESGQPVKVLSLENYRLNAKAELSKNEIIAFKIILRTLLDKYLKGNPFEQSFEYSEAISSVDYQNIQKEIDELKFKLGNGERVKGKLEEKEIAKKKYLKKVMQRFKFRMESDLRNDASSKYYQYKNAAHLRYGWAMTAHKAMSYKWQEVVFCVDQGKMIGRTNANYFRWLYTGLTRATQKIYLFNYESITPYDKTEFRDNNTGIRPQDIFFHSYNHDQNLRLQELKEFVLLKLSAYQLRLVRVEHLNWQERYSITNENNQEAIISFFYNGQGNFRPPIIQGYQNLCERILVLLKGKTALKSFSEVNDPWRRKEYSNLNDALSIYNIYFELIFQANYKDKIRFFSETDELEIELDYDGDGMISFISAKYYSDKIIWENFRKAIEQIKS